MPASPDKNFQGRSGPSMPLLQLVPERGSHTKRETRMNASYPAGPGASNRHLFPGLFPGFQDATPVRSILTSRPRRKIRADSAKALPPRAPGSASIAHYFRSRASTCRSARLGQRRCISQQARATGQDVAPTISAANGTCLLPATHDPFVHPLGTSTALCRCYP